MRRSLLLLISLILVGSLFGCKKATDPLDEILDNTMSANIGGTNYEGVSNIAKYYLEANTNTKWLAISAYRTTSSLALNIDTAAVPGTFIIDTSAVNPKANAYYTPDNTTTAYRAYRGSITLESRTADRVKGTFAVTMQKVGGSHTDTLVVSGGKFNMSYTTRF